jgi:galactokinase
MGDAPQPTSTGGPDAVGSAAGRVNLIGEHTDYCGGWVLPLSLPLVTRVELRHRRDKWVTARTALHGEAPGRYRLGEERTGQGWLDYVQGVTVALRKAGFTLGGVDLDFTSTVPAGGGLASSAALCVALLRALGDAFHLPLNVLEVARLAQRAETDFVGAPVGIMDPLAASFAKFGSALFIDTLSLDTECIALPPELEVGVLHSGVTHRNAGGTYAERRQEAEAAALALGVRTLREVAENDIERLAKLPLPLARRARHVLSENARVLAFVAALKNRDIARLGPLLEASHHSLRDDYEVSHPLVDTLVELAWADAGVLGARMTGGGLGGSVLYLTRAGQAFDVGSRLGERYHSVTGQPGTLLWPTLPEGRSD